MRRLLAVAALLLLGMFPKAGATGLASAGAGCSQIVVANADGSSQKILASPGNNAAPRWSPDGTKLAFTSDRAGGSDVYVRELTTGKEVQLTHDQDGSYPSWLSNTELVLSHKFGTLARIRIDGKGGLTNFPGVANVFFTQPTVSPDGKLIASYGETVNGGPRLVYLLPANGSGTPQPLPGQEGGLKNWFPIWKSATELSYVSMRADGTHLVTFNLQTKASTVDPAINGLGQWDWTSTGSAVYSAIYQPGSYSMVEVKVQGTSRAVQLGEAPTFAPDEKTIAFVGHTCGQEQAWNCVPVFYPMGVADIRISGTDAITFSTTLAGGVDYLSHENEPTGGNLKAHAKVGWSKPSAGLYSSRWQVENLDAESVGLNVGTTWNGTSLQLTQIDCYRALRHLHFAGAEKVHLQGLGIDEVIPLQNGVGTRRWLPMGAYIATPIITGTEQLSLRKDALLLNQDGSLSWSSPSSTSGGQPQTQSQHRWYFPAVFCC